MRVVLFIAAALLCVQQAAAETVEKRVSADPRGEVKIGNVAGDVQVLGWDRAEVLVNAELGGRDDRLEVQSHGTRTVIQVVVPGGGEGSSRASELVVHVPRNSSLSVNTVKADQQIEDVRGAQWLQAVSGSITTQVWGSEFEAKTVSGEVTVQGHGGAGVMRITTVSGSVRIENAAAELELSTVSGDLDVKAGEVRRARINTTNGDLDLSAALARGGRIEAEAINGDLRFHLRGSLDAQFDIETFNGDIDNCFGPEPQRTRRFAPGNELRFSQGQGSAQVRIKTLNGTIELCKE